MEPSAAIEDRVRQEATKLERFFEHITGCHAVIEAPHKHHHKGKLYKLRLALHVPDAELVVSHEHHGRHEHEDVYVAIRDAFSALRKQLDAYVQKRKSKTKAPIPNADEGEATATATI